MTSEDATKINSLLANLWERGLPQLRERLEVLDRAVIAAAAGDLTEALRMEALEIAHKLAGSLGMFGYVEGTEIARRLERLLANLTPTNSSGLAQLVAQLRQALQVQ